MKIRLLIVGLLLNLCTLPAFAADPSNVETWQQWRGPSRDGILSETAWPANLKSVEKVWSTPLGPSYSSPVVSRDRVFTTETVDRKFEVVRALDRATGKSVWETQWRGSTQVPFFAASNGSWIRATPILNEGRLYVGGIRGVLVCLKSEDGKELWRIDFGKKYGTGVPSFGFVCSPLIEGDFLYVQAGGRVAKVHKVTGEIVWTTLAEGGGMTGGAFSSPVMRTIHGTEQLLVQTRAKLAGVHPADGKVLWQIAIPSFRGMNILTPTVIDNKVFTSSYGGGSFLFDIKSDNGSWSASEIWRNRAQGYMSSPVVIDGAVYLHLRNQRFTCIDLETGKTLWTSKTFGKYWSLVASGDKILALDQRGDLLFIQADKTEFKLIDRHEVASDSWAHLAVCGDQLFVRELDAMTVWQWK